MTIYILGDNSTQYIKIDLIEKFKKLGFDFDVMESEYDQINLQVLDKNSKYNKVNPEFTVIYMSSEKLLERFNRLPDNERESFYFTIIKEIEDIWENINRKIIQFNFIEIEQKLFGNFSARIVHSFEYQIRKLNVLISDLAIKHGQYILDLSSIQNRIGRQNLFNASQYYLGKVTISTKYIDLVSNMIIDIVISEKGKQVKCVILDLDNTLWGGVIGDDGISKIQIGELGKGKIYSDLQSYFKNLKKRGIILCICSKNNLNNAKEPFESHPDMILKLDDIVIFVANWEDKSNNIKDIQSVLNISFDSIVFIDDNPMERDLVRTFLPDVIVPELPKNAHRYLDYIISQNLFEVNSISKDDLNRTAMYKEESLRIESKQKFSDTNKYMENLSMGCTVKKVDEFLIPRVSQLTQRSNQFNLRTKRYSEKDIKNMIDSNYKILTFSLKDKFGDYGMISVLILDIQDDFIFIDTFIISCRVLKRGVEYFIMNYLVEYCNKMKIEKICSEYIQTSKNDMVKDLYTKLGFTKVSNDKYLLNTYEYNKIENYIKEV